ncbi:PRC and DUF2382 domain-containing protein [soil metagenome]
MTDNQTTYQDWIGHQVVDQDGEKVGKIEELYLDDATGAPEWLAIKTGMFGSKQSFAPIAGAQNSGDDLQLAFTKDQVKDAPKVDPDGHLEPDEEAELYRHYGRQADYDEAPSQEPSGGGRDTGGDTARDTARDTGHDTSGPDTDDAMTRSEEELAVGTRSREAGRARLRKYVVTEDVSTTVPVRKETAHIEREPITDANRDAATSGGDITEEDHEMVLNEVEVVVDKKVTPKERVRLDKDVEVTDETVTDEVRKEQVEMDEGQDQKRS